MLLTHKTIFLRTGRLCKFSKFRWRAFSSGGDDLRPFEQIPGPRRLPFLGNLNDLLILGPNAKLHETIDNYHKKYGPIFRTTIGGCNSLFLSAPDLMRSVFRYEGKYPKHPLPAPWTHYNTKYGWKRGLFFMDDDEWLHHRTILNRLLLRDVHWMAGPIQTNCDILVDYVKSHQPLDSSASGHFEIPDLENQLYQLSIHVILSLMLGGAFDVTARNRLASLIARFACINQDIFEYTSQLYGIPPQLAERLHLPAWKGFVKAVVGTMELANEILDDFLRRGDYGDGLLRQMRASGISDDNVARIFVDFLLAAGDTSSYATQWALFSLAKDTRIQQEVRLGIQAEGDLMESTLVRATVRESLRLYPVAPFIGRILMTESVIGQYRCPPVTLALLSLYSAGRDPNNFSQPDNFLPSRWLRESKPSELDQLTPQASLPYAIGARSCIGKKIANLQMHTALTKLLVSFELRLLNTKNVRMKLKMVAVPSEKLRIGFKLLKN